MKIIIKISTFIILSFLLIIGIGFIVMNKINENEAKRDYSEIQKQLLLIENEKNILKNKKFYDSKKNEGTRRVIFKDDNEVEYIVYLTNGVINIEPLYYDIKKYKNPEDTRHYFDSSKE